MTLSNDKIAGLIGSRICHDLISPIGAIANGLELLELTGAGIQGPEFALVSDSAKNASARIRLFRIVFGDSAPDQAIRAEEVDATLRAIYSDARITVQWAVQGTFPRAEVKAALLAMLCAEDALGHGGKIDLHRTESCWVVNGTGTQLTTSTSLWDTLTDAAPQADIPPAKVQFALLPDAVRQIGGSLAARVTNNAVTITF